MALRDQAFQFQRALAVGSNSTQTGAYAATVPTTTEPSGAGVISLQSVPGYANAWMLLCPFGIGADLTTFKMLAVGWRAAALANSLSLWIPVPLAQFLCTLSSGVVGVAASAVLNTESFCDTLALTGGNSNVDVTVLSPHNFGTPLEDFAALALVDVKGFTYLQLLFDLGGSATSANCLTAPLG